MRDQGYDRNLLDLPMIGMELTISQDEFERILKKFKLDLNIHPHHHPTILQLSARIPLQALFVPGEEKEKKTYLPILYYISLIQTVIRQIVQ